MYGEAYAAYKANGCMYFFFEMANILMDACMVQSVGKVGIIEKNICNKN
jgi:hypothetical protein